MDQQADLLAGMTTSKASAGDFEGHWTHLTTGASFNATFQEGHLSAQVESYSNLVDPVLEAMRNLTPLAFDVLTFLIIDKLASSGRQKLKVANLHRQSSCEFSRNAQSHAMHEMDSPFLGSIIHYLHLSNYLQSTLK